MCSNRKIHPSSMSSAKAYELEVSPTDPSAGVIKFVVREPKGWLLERRKTLAWSISSVLAVYVSHIVKTDWQLLLERDIAGILRPGNVHLWVLGVLLSALVLLYSRQQRQDSLTVIKDMGVQLHSQAAWRFISKHDKNVFIPLSSIIDLVIHEGFHGFGQVIFYICVLTRRSKQPAAGSPTSPAGGVIEDLNKNDGMITVAFSEMLPRKDILVEVWKRSRQLLFGQSRKYWRRVPGQGLKECT